MSAPGRWLRLDIGCFESDWLIQLSPAAQHAWTRLLLYVKGAGMAGTAKRLGPVAVERLWGIGAADFHAMENAAIGDSALIASDGTWTVTGWQKYQEPDRTNALRKRRLRARQATPTIPDDTGGMDRSPPGTRHATETVTLTVTEETSTPRAAKGKKRKGTPTYPDDFLALWAIRPRGPKDKAYDEYRRAVPDRIEAAALAGCYGRYVDIEVNDRFHGHDIFRWIRDGRWEEYLSANGNGNSKPRTIMHDGLMLRT